MEVWSVAFHRSFEKWSCVRMIQCAISNSCVSDWSVLLMLWRKAVIWQKTLNYRVHSGLICFVLVVTGNISSAWCLHVLFTMTYVQETSLLIHWILVVVSVLCSVIPCYSLFGHHTICPWSTCVSSAWTAQTSSWKYCAACLQDTHPPAWWSILLPKLSGAKKSCQHSCAMQPQP